MPTNIYEVLRATNDITSGVPRSLPILLGWSIPVRKWVLKMNRGQDAVIHVREERAVIGGVEVAKKTVIAATDGGDVIAYQMNTVQAVGSGSGNNNPSIGHPGQAQRAPRTSYPQQGGYPASTTVVIADPPERDCSYHCFACDDEYKWYDLRGKGICWLLLLLLLWLLVVAIVIPLVVLCLVCKCLAACSDDN